MRTLATAAFLVVFVAGCGSDDDATTAAATAVEASAEPTEPFGEYAREVTQAEIDEKGETVRPEGWTAPPAGTYRLTLNAGSIVVTDPDGGSIGQELTLTDGTLAIKRYIGSEGLAFCRDDAPSSYAWEHAGDELVLTAKNEACGDREAILAGTWAKSR
ncbi:MAG TPA: hypothetical protein VHF67_11120 [Gaiellaceae bacterium]|nr:hypothetical protein [Gaiellaceae bacterium]